MSNSKAVGRAARLAMHLGDYDWAAQQWRTGNRTVPDLADEIGVRKEHLFDYIQKEKISKDLSSQIAARANDMLAVNAAPENGVMPFNEEDIIRINATMQASLILRHREDISRARRLVMQMLTELEFQTDHQDLFDDFGSLCRQEDKHGQDKVNDVYKRIISVVGRVDSMKKIAESMKILIMLERQAFSIRDDFEDPSVKDARVKQIQAIPGGADSFAKITEKFRKISNQASKVLAEDAVIHVERPTV